MNTYLNVQRCKKITPTLGDTSDTTGLVRKNALFLSADPAAFHTA